MQRFCWKFWHFIFNFENENTDGFRLIDSVWYYWPQDQWSLRCCSCIKFSTIHLSTWNLVVKSCVRNFSSFKVSRTFPLVKLPPEGYPPSQQIHPWKITTWKIPPQDSLEILPPWRLTHDKFTTIRFKIDSNWINSLLSDSSRDKSK